MKLFSLPTQCLMLMALLSGNSTALNAQMQTPACKACDHIHDARKEAHQAVRTVGCAPSNRAAGLDEDPACEHLREAKKHLAKAAREGHCVAPRASRPRRLEEDMPQERKARRSRKMKSGAMEYGERVEYDAEPVSRGRKKRMNRRHSEE